MQHTNIVRLYGVCLDDPSERSVSLLMELAPLGSLRTVLDATPGLYIDTLS